MLSSLSFSFSEKTIIDSTYQLNWNMLEIVSPKSELPSIHFLLSYTEPCQNI